MPGLASRLAVTMYMVRIRRMVDGDGAVATRFGGRDVGKERKRPDALDAIELEIQLA